MINIAIDGPSGAGKSTLSSALAEQLGFIHVDTGALYRAIGLFVRENGADTRDEQAVKSLLPEIKLNIVHTGQGQRVILCGKDVSEAIRRPEISMAASDVSAIPAVRDFLLGLQKDIASKNNVIMDGRDIGTVVLPQAQIKIFLTASAEERARRRTEELKERGTPVSYDKVLAEMIARDEQDSNRKISPLRPAEDAITVDTTGFEIPKSIKTLTAVIKERLT